MYDPFRLFSSPAPQPPREAHVEWNALGLGLFLGIVFGLSNVYGRSQPPSMVDGTASEKDPIVVPKAAEAAPPQSAPTTSERRKNAVPVQWVSEQRAKSQTASAVAPLPRKKRPAVPVTGARTLAYWNGLNEVIAKEAEMRAPPPNITAANAAAFLSSRTAAAKYAAQAILNLDARGVDKELLLHAKGLAEWYQAEEKLSARGSFLLEKADAKTRKGAGGKQWKSGEEEHRQKCAELNQHGVELQTTFSKKYELEFPPLL